MLFALLVFALLLIILSPYILIVSKRRKMLRELEAVARKNGFVLRRLHRLVCFSPNRAPRYDILFESRTRAFAVKLWSTARQGSTLYITPDGKTRESVNIPPELDTEKSAGRTLNGKKKTVAVTRDNFKVRKGKPTERVLLYYPQNKGIFFVARGIKKPLADGDRFFDKVLCSPEYFKKMISEKQ